MEDFYLEACGILGGPHMWLLHAFTWPYYYIWAYSWRVKLWRHFLLFLEVHILLFDRVLAWSKQ
jgi:hypothetical protein